MREAAIVRRIGGGRQQQHLYFLVAQDGTFLIKHRDGEGTSDIQSETENGAVMVPSGAGRSANTLEVQVSGDTITYVVNRVVVLEFA